MSNLRRCSSCVEVSWLDSAGDRLQRPLSKFRRFWGHLWSPRSLRRTESHLSVSSAVYPLDSVMSSTEPDEKFRWRKSRSADHEVSTVAIDEQEEKRYLMQKAEEQLKKTETADVAFVLRACVNYDGPRDERCPIPGRALSISNSGFLQVKEKFNDEWWIGRVVKEGCEDGFIPSPKELERKSCPQTHNINRSRKKSTTAGREAPDCSQDVSRPRSPADTASNDGKSNGESDVVTEPVRTHRSYSVAGKSLLHSGGRHRPESVRSYELVPHTRPILLVGPSLKGFEVTDLMQEAVIDCLKRHFRDRLRTVTIYSRQASTWKPGLGLGAKISSQGILGDIRDNAPAVYDEAKAMDLLLLETNVSYPIDFIKAGLAPLVIYIRINSMKVLKRLIRSRGKAQAKGLGDQLAAAEKLAQMNPAMFDLILDENQLDEACDKAVAFLELQWRATATRRPSSISMSTSRRTRSLRSLQHPKIRRSIRETRQYTDNPESRLLTRVDPSANTAGMNLSQNDSLASAVGFGVTGTRDAPLSQSRSGTTHVTLP